MYIYLCLQPVIGLCLILSLMPHKNTALYFSLYVNRKEYTMPDNTLQA